MNNSQNWSRLKGFFALSVKERRQVLSLLPLAVNEKDFLTIDQGLLLDDADRMSENVVGTFSLPFSIAVNFVIDGQPVLVPMVTEESSIVAACSKMAKLVSQTSGFVTDIDKALIKGQIQVIRLQDIDKAQRTFIENKAEIMEFAKSLCPNMSKRGGGIVDIGLRVLPSADVGPMVVVEPLIDVVDAMGANVVNTILEALAGKVEKLLSGTVCLRILSNLCDQRLARAKCAISFSQLATDSTRDNGVVLAERMIAAHALAQADIYRACTHNKGILNGIDAVAIATGNDFRAIEAGAHAFAAKDGSYRPLTTISIDYRSQLLNAELILPLAVGVVGGISSVHQGVAFAHKVLGSFRTSSRRLSSVMVSVGLSQCLAALMALCDNGIQKGHMKLHKKKLAFDMVSPSA